MEITDEERNFKERVKMLKKLYPSLDILMCETLLRTPESRLNELYEQYRDNYPVGESEPERVLNNITIQHFDAPEATVSPDQTPPTTPRSVIESPFN